MKQRDNWYDDHFKVIVLFAILLSVLNFGVAVTTFNSIGEEHDFDAISVSLTVLEMFLATVALGGFFLLRGAAMRAAADEARLTAEKVAKDELKVIAPPMVGRAVIEYLELFAQKSGADDSRSSMNDLMQALDEPDNGGTNGG